MSPRLETRACFVVFVLLHTFPGVHSRVSKGWQGLP